MHANDYVAKKEKAWESSKIHRKVVILSTIIAEQLFGWFESFASEGCSKRG